MKNGVRRLLFCFFAVICNGQGDAIYKQGTERLTSSPEEAYELFVLAAEQGNVSAMVGAGYCIETGTGAPNDYSKAIAWYEKAVAQNSVKACEGLARIYATCPDPEFHDGIKAVKYATAVVRKMPGNGDALALLAAAHARNVDFAQAIKIQSEAIRCCPLEQVGAFKQRIESYRACIPYPDVVSAVWILSAADKGLPWGMFKQGMQCKMVGANEQMAHWLLKAVAAGSADAAIELGDCYVEGSGTPMNVIKAAECYRTALKAGKDLGKSRNEWLSFFDKVWDQVKYDSGEQCYMEGKQHEGWAQKVQYLDGVEMIRGHLKNALFFYSIAVSKDYTAAMADYQRLKQDKRLRAPPSDVRSIPKDTVAKRESSAVTRLMDEAIEARKAGDIKMEFDLFMKAYKLDPTARNGYAASAISHIYLKGCEGLPQNRQEALEWEIKAADQGYPPSLISVVGRFAMANRGDEADCDAEKAMKYANMLIPIEYKYVDNYNYWEVIGGAFARAGRFEEAIQYQSKAIEVLHSPDGRRHLSEEDMQRKHDAMVERVALYGSGKPFSYAR